jgi:chromosome segregation ATPase
MIFFFTVITAIIFGGILFVVLRVIRSQATKSVGKERDLLKEDINKFDSAIELSLKRLGELKSYSIVEELGTKVAAAQKEFDVELAKVQKLEKEVKTFQGKVDAQEAKHSELKRGKDDCDQLANEIRARKDKVEEDCKALNEQLGTGMLAIQRIATSPKMKQETMAALDQFADMLDRIQTQYNEILETYRMCSSRFANLEKQYTELEREYQKLLAREEEEKQANQVNQ